VVVVVVLLWMCCGLVWLLIEWSVGDSDMHIINIFINT